MKEKGKKDFLKHQYAIKKKNKKDTKNFEKEKL